METIQYSSIFKRAVAMTIDDIVVSLLFFIIFYEQIVSLKDTQTMILFLNSNLWILLLLKVLYHGFLIGYNGATLGKYLLKMRALDELSLQAIGIKRGFLRALIREVGESFFYFTFFYAFFNEKRQTLHDKIVNCVVVDV